MGYKKKTKLSRNISCKEQYLIYTQFVTVIWKTDSIFMLSHENFRRHSYPISTSFITYKAYKIMVLQLYWEKQEYPPLGSDWRMDRITTQDLMFLLFRIKFI